MSPLHLRLSHEIPLIHDGLLLAMITAIEPQAAAHPGLRAARERLRPSYTTTGGVAVLEVSGVLMQKPDLWDAILGEAEDSDALRSVVTQAANDPEVEALVLNLDTPGGMVTGGVELADAVAAADKIKPVVAWTGSLAASLGYLIASQASVVMATRSAQVGSIGSILTVADFSGMLEKFGVKLHTFTNKEGDLKSVLPLNEERSAYLQSVVDKAFGMFRGSVLSRRPGIEAGSMRGQLFTGSDGRRNGMVDRIGDLGFAISTARSQVRKRKREGA